MVHTRQDPGEARAEAYASAVAWFRERHVTFIAHYKAGPRRPRCDDAGWLQPPPPKKS